ncbi:MAG: response regulator [Treponema sp.]|jgi:CheY-like chemotaxis protein|nr:response regulator [Treponema sp.]
MPDVNEKRKLLLVDDDEIHLAITGNMLKGEYEIITAKSGKEALGHLLKGVVPDLILLDIIMPNMDGWETYNRIRGISLLRDVPIAFLTSLDGKDEVQQAHEMGAADFIPKSCQKEEFLTRIDTIITNYEEK